MPTDIYRRPGLYIPQVYCWVASRNSLVSVMHFYILCFIILVSDAVIHLITGFLVFSATILYLLSWHTIFNHFLNHYNVTSHHHIISHHSGSSSVQSVNADVEEWSTARTCGESLYGTLSHWFLGNLYFWLCLCSTSMLSWNCF